MEAGRQRGRDRGGREMEEGVEVEAEGGERDGGHSMEKGERDL